MAGGFAIWWRRLRDPFGPAPVPDPLYKVRLAVEHLHRSHQVASQKASSMIGQQRQTEMRLGQLISNVEKLKASMRQAHQLADDGRRDGDQARLTQYLDAAMSFMEQLKSAQANLRQMRAMNARAVALGEESKRAFMAYTHKLERKTMDMREVEMALQYARFLEQPANSPVWTPGTGDTSRDWLRQRYLSPQSAMEGDDHGPARGVSGSVTTRRLAQIRAALREQDVAEEETP